MVTISSLTSGVLVKLRTLKDVSETLPAGGVDFDRILSSLVFSFLLDCV
jgi:hypothetical protein